MRKNLSLFVFALALTSNAFAAYETFTVNDIVTGNQYRGDYAGAVNWTKSNYQAALLKAVPASPLYQAAANEALTYANTACRYGGCNAQTMYQSLLKEIDTTIANRPKAVATVAAPKPATFASKANSK
jgi:hypothetical protein